MAVPLRLYWSIGSTGRCLAARSPASLRKRPQLFFVACRRKRAWSRLLHCHLRATWRNRQGVNQQPDDELSPFRLRHLLGGTLKSVNLSPSPLELVSSR